MSETPGDAREPAGEGSRSEPLDRGAMKNMVASNVAFSILGKVWYMATRLFLPPVILRFVTLEEYGIWATCFILIGYLGMSAFGVSNVYIRYVAEYQAKGEMGKINRLVSTGILVTSGICVALLAAVWFLMPFLLDAFHIAGPLRETASLLILGTAAAFLLDLSLGAYAYVLHGLQRVAVQNVVWMATFTLEAVLIIVLLFQGLGIRSLLWAFAARYVVAIVAYAVVCHRVLPGLRLSFALFDRASLRLFFGYGAIVQLSGLLGMVLWSMEKLLAGVFLGVSATGLLDVGEKLPQTAISIPSSINVAFLPAASYLEAQGRKDEMLKLYVKGGRYLNLLSGLIMGFLAPFALFLMVAWLGEKEMTRTAAAILAIFTVPYQVHVLTGPGSAFFRGAGQPLRELVYAFTQIGFLAATIPVGFLLFGKTILVICGAVAVSMVASGLVYLVYTNRVLGLAHGLYFRRAFLPGFVPYLVGGLLVLAVQPLWGWAVADRLRALALVGGAGLVYGVVALGTAYRLLCDWGEREYLRKQIAHTLGKAFGRKGAA